MGIADWDANFGWIDDILLVTRVNQTWKDSSPCTEKILITFHIKSNNLRYSDVDNIRNTGATIYILL